MKISKDFHSYKLESVSDVQYAKKCKETKHVCGDVVYAAQIDGGLSGVANFNIQCNQSHSICFKLPKDARRDYRN